MQVTTAREWRGGWGTLFACFFAYGISGSYPQLLTLFISPLEREFGWSRASITSGLLGVSVLCLVAMPFAGMLIDRFGSKRIGVPGMILFCSGIALLGTTSGSIWNWWGLWVIMAIAGVVTHITLWITAVGKIFDSSRGTALALMMCGSGAIQAVYPMPVNWMIANYGWRSGFISYGLVCMAITIPLLIFLFREKRSSRNEAKAAGVVRPLTGITPRAAFRSWTFYRIALITFLMTGSIVALGVNFMPLMTELGIQRSLVAAALSLYGIGSVVGRLVTGVLLDRFHGAMIGVIGFLVPSIGVSIVLFFGVSDLSVFAVAALLGLGMGIEIDIVAYISTRYFGLKHYATIFGTIGGVMTFSSGVGPMIGGLLHDYFGSYTVLLFGTLAAFVTSSILIGSLGRYPVFEPTSGDVHPGNGNLA